MIEQLRIGRTECSTSSKVAGNRRDPDVIFPRDPDRGVDMRTTLFRLPSEQAKVPGTPVEKTCPAVRWRIGPLRL
jgi:hypothetical protein